jgi:predicted Zn-dependent protease
MPKKLIFFILIFISFLAKNSFAQSLISDAQTEKFLHELSDPIFRAANLDPKNIKIYIVNDDSINAFVSGGQNVFINTGLIRKFSTPDALIGVIAHETGHIAAGHLARSGEGIEQAQNAMFLSYILGIGAIIAGSPDAGMALISGGSDSAQRLLMKFTRNQEEAADQHAVEYLDNISYPIDGLVKLLEIFQTEMIGYRGKIDEYLLSHPVSQKRIDLIKARTKDKKFTDKKINQKLQGTMDIVLAKLEAFIENPDAIYAKYKNRHDEISNYKKSIALFRKGNVDQSLKLLDEIIDKKTPILPNFLKHNSPELGFLYELKGQILYESGQVQDAILAYNETIKFLSALDGAQAKISFATGILTLNQNDKTLLQLAIKKLEEASIFENENPFLFKQLANAYLRMKDEGRSLLALAEYNFLIGDKKKCVKYAKEAKEKLDKSAKVELLRADDLLDLAEDEKDKEKDKDKDKEKDKEKEKGKDKVIIP